MNEPNQNSDHDDETDLYEPASTETEIFDAVAHHLKSMEGIPLAEHTRSRYQGGRQ